MSREIMHSLFHFFLLFAEALSMMSMEQSPIPDLL